MSESPVKLERQDATAVITLDSPATRNAFSAAMKDALERAVNEVVADGSVRAVVLTGSGGQFCAGGDVRSMASAQRTPAEWRARMQETHRWLRELIVLDKPLIAAVDGAAYGAGFSMALAADFVLATPRARFSMSFMKLGLVPDAGASYTLPRVVGAQRARELMLSAREVRAPEALSLGIAMELHEPDRLLARALELAASFAGASPLAVSLLKRNTLDAGALDAALDAEANAQALAFLSPEYREAARRFIDKEPSAFQWPSPHPSPVPQAGEGARQGETK